MGALEVEADPGWDPDAASLMVTELPSSLSARQARDGNGLYRYAGQR